MFYFRPRRRFRSGKRFVFARRPNERYLIVPGLMRNCYHSRNTLISVIIVHDKPTFVAIMKSERFPMTDLPLMYNKMRCTFVRAPESQIRYIIYYAAWDGRTGV